LKTSPIRVFLDSSVLFSAFYSSKGFARDLLSIGHLPQVELWISQVAVVETRRNLARNGSLLVDAFEHHLATASIHHADPPGALLREVAQVIVPKDAPIVAGAVSSRAKYLATYDRAHLLTRAELIRDLFGLEVATPQDVLVAITGYMRDERC